MPEPSSFDRISPTALMVAYAREFSDIPYAAELAMQVNAASVLDTLAVPDRQPLAYLAGLIEARYRAVDRGLAQSGCGQILELASGLLPRGMIWSQNPDLVYVESDLPQMLHLKQKLVRQLVGDRPNLHFQAIDATHRPSEFPLAAPWRIHEPIAIVCEGLLLYLTLPEKAWVCANVRELLQQFGGVWITPDFYTPSPQAKRHGLHPAARQLFQAVTALTGRSLTETGFRDQAQVRQFLTAQGFQVEMEIMLEVMSDLSCFAHLAHLGGDRASMKSWITETPVFMLRLAA